MSKLDKERLIREAKSLPVSEIVLLITDVIVSLEERGEELEAQLAEHKFKADAYDAMCEVGLIQYGGDPETRFYSVWGFTCWHHDPDILKAIAAANEPVKLQAIINREKHS